MATVRPIARLAAACALALGLAACQAHWPPERYDPFFTFNEEVHRVFRWTARDNRNLALRYGDWVRLEYIGPQDAPTMTHWLSPRPMGKEPSLNRFVTLTPAAYQRLATRLSALNCASPEDLPPVELTIAAGQKVARRCELNKDEVCEVVSALQSLDLGEVINGDTGFSGFYADICLHWDYPSAVTAR